MKVESRDIPLQHIHETHLLLRLVVKESLEYLELRDSLAVNGPLNSICVRPSQKWPGEFEVVDGMYRYTAFQELGMSPVPCLIREMTDEQVIAAQIQANAIRPTTKPTDFARQLKKILDANPGMSQARLQGMIHKAPHWIGEQLGLLKLRPEIQRMVDRGEIPLMSAYMLSQVLSAYQLRFVDLAKTAPVHVFKATVAVFVKKQREAARQGKLDAIFNDEFTPVAYLRGLRELLAEKKRPENGPLLLAAANARTPIDGWNICLDWIAHLDPQSLEEQQLRQRDRMRKNFSEET